MSIMSSVRIGVSLVDDAMSSMMLFPADPFVIFAYNTPSSREEIPLLNLYFIFECIVFL